MSATKDRYFFITMPDGSEWAVPVSVIAADRAAYYAPRNHGGDLVASMEATLALFDDDDELIADWATGNMNWDDVKSHAKQGKEPSPPDYADGWVNGAWEVGEWK